MLTREQILKAIQDKRLTVEPLLEKFQVGFCSLDIRIGTHLQLSAEPNKFIEQNCVGDSVLLLPSTFARVASLETIRLAPDIAGLLISYSVFSNAGLLVPSSWIDPGYEGMLALTIFNLSGSAQRLFVGERFARIFFFKLEGDVSLPYSIPEEKYGLAEDLDRLLDTGMIRSKWVSEGEAFRRVFTSGSEALEVTRAMENEIKRISSVRHAQNLQCQLDSILEEKNTHKKGHTHKIEMEIETSIS